MIGMRSIIVVFLVLMTAFAASAAEQKVVTGTFVVSFDLNGPAKYTVDKNDPALGVPEQVEPGLWNKADTYSFNILGANNSREVISLIRWENNTDATMSKELSLQKIAAQLLGFSEVSGGFVDVDGQIGYAMILQNPKNQAFHLTWYWLDRVLVPNSVVSTGRTEVVVRGNLTNQEAASLLKTLHVNSGSTGVISST